MEKDLQVYKEQTFEEIKHIDEYGNEFWYARELMSALEYNKWEHFSKVIDKARISCKTSGENVEAHFPVIGKIVKSGVNKKHKSLVLKVIIALTPILV